MAYTPVALTKDLRPVPACADPVTSRKRWIMAHAKSELATRQMTAIVWYPSFGTKITAANMPRIEVVAASLAASDWRRVATATTARKEWIKIGTMAHTRIRSTLGVPAKPAPYSSRVIRSAPMDSGSANKKGSMYIVLRYFGAITKTLGNTALALVLALGVGIVAGALLHRVRALRDTLDPLFATYYAVPVFAFYPFFIVVFGLGDMPQILIAFMLGVVAVIVNTLNGLDRVPVVLLKTARIMKLSPIDTALRMTLPSAGPYLLTGIKLAVAYAFIGVIGSEFIMSRGGIGYEISFAYANFDNATMYPLIVLILLASVAINGVLSRWEQRLLVRRGMR